MIDSKFFRYKSICFCIFFHKWPWSLFAHIIETCDDTFVDTTLYKRILCLPTLYTVDACLLIWVIDSSANWGRALSQLIETFSCRYFCRHVDLFRNILFLHPTCKR